MGGRSLFDIKQTQYDIELASLLASDQKCYQMMAMQQQSVGRALRTKPMEMKVICGRSGAGKSIFGKFDPKGRIMDIKGDENTDVKNVEFDYIGELLVDTRSYDIDEDNMGIIVLNSTVVSLKGGISADLQYREQLSAMDIPKLLGIDLLDECEVDLGIIRFVFGFIAVPEMLLNHWTVEAEPNYEHTLLGKHKYPYQEEEVLDKEFSED